MGPWAEGSLSRGAKGVLYGCRVNFNEGLCKLFGPVQGFISEGWRGNAHFGKLIRTLDALDLKLNKWV